MTVRRAREVTLLSDTADAPRRVMRGFSYSSHSVSEVAGWRRAVRAPSWDCHRFASLARSHHNMRRVHARDHSRPTSDTRLRDSRRLRGRPFSAGPGGLRRYPWLRPCRCTLGPHSSHPFPRKRRASGIAALHGAIEFAVGVALIVLPWLVGWVGMARMFYGVAGAVLLG